MKPLDVVVITTKTSLEIKGVLREEASDAFVLTSAALAGNGPNMETIWSDLAGEVVVPFSNVDYYQRSLPPDILSKL
jgi:hypothetical protein